MTESELRKQIRESIWRHMEPWANPLAQVGQIDRALDGASDEIISLMHRWADDQPGSGVKAPAPTQADPEKRWDAVRIAYGKLLAESHDDLRANKDSVKRAVLAASAIGKTEASGE